MIPGGIPTKETELLPLVQQWIEQCEVSVGARSAYYRLLNAAAETGRYDGTKALINVLNKHLDRTAAHLFSPIELKFSMDFENPYQSKIYAQGKKAAEVTTRHWDRTNTDTLFGRGVFDALKYGAAIIKQWPTYLDDKELEPAYHRRLVMPWNFGVYREDENDIDAQEMVCETTWLTLPEVWQRIYRFPDREKLFNRVKANTVKGGQASAAAPQSFFHQVLSTSQIQTGVNSATLPGGIVQVANDPNYSVMGPVIAAEMVKLRELWVKDEEDYVTIQVIEPDILVAPHTMRSGNDRVITKKANLFIPGTHLHPYTLIQPNEMTDWFWGRSELVDLMEPQMLLSSWCDDAKRLFGLQIDKILAFIGSPGIDDERYDQFRAAGYLGLDMGAKVEDLTPKIPPEMLPMIKWLLEMINWLGSFPPVMQGQGEAGVRAQAHADTLVKTASPTLRDRSLIVERNCARAADKTLSMMEAKESRFFYTKADTPTDVEETKFLLRELPEDWRITVDSHSSSPIFSNENTQLVFAAQGRGVVDEEYVIDNTQLPDKESAKVRLRQKAAAKQQLMQKLLQQDPKVAEKVLEKELIPARKR